MGALGTDRGLVHPELESVPCNLCGARDERLLFERPYVLDGLSGCGGFAATTDRFEHYGRVVRCARCSLVYTNPRPKSPALLEGYRVCMDETYATEASGRSINAHFNLNTIKRFVSSGRLLEVGASTGYFLNAARVDFEVAGLEPCEWACRIARERFKLEVHPETLESQNRFAPGQWDVVVLIDVLEHLTDPRVALERSASLLRPGGVLYAVTPDISSLTARLMRGYWWGLRPAHIYYYDRRTLGRALEQAGFEVLRIHSVGRIFSYGYWLSRLRHYPSVLRRPLGWAIRTMGVEDKFLYLDTRDSMEVCARKR